MDDYQVILYIVFGILYFIFNLLKNRAKPPVSQEGDPQEDTSKDQPDRPRRRETVSDPFDETVGRPRRKASPSSFEEILQEFEDASYGAGKKAEEKVKKIQEVDDEFQSLEGADTSFSEQEAEKRIRETEARKALQEEASAAKRAEAIDREVNRKLQETTHEMQVQERTFKGRMGQQENKRRKQLLQMLQNPESLKATIVAAEVLKRKHF